MDEIEIACFDFNILRCSIVLKFIVLASDIFKTYNSGRPAPWP
jgi:hypothetical protein